MTAPNPLQRRYAEEIHTLFAQAPLVLFFSSAASCLAAWIFWEHPQRRWILAWLPLQLLLQALRGAMVVAFLRGGVILRPRRWAMAYALTAGLAGLGWGLLAPLVFNPADTRSLYIALLFLSTFVAGAVTTLPWYLPAFALFTLGAMGPPTLLLLAQDDHQLFATGLGCLCYLGFNLAVAKRVREKMVVSVRLNLENLDLLQRLGAEKARAERAHLTKSRFLAALSHDLRHPLRALELHIEHLTLKGDPWSRSLKPIRASAASLSAVFNGLLDLAKLQSAPRPELRALPLRPLFQRLTMGLAPAFRHQGAKLKALPIDATVLADPIYLERLLRNLLDNAVRHGGKQVSLAARRSGATVRISVGDDGPGLPGRGAGASATRDAGLGLDIVLQLAQAMDLKISVRTKKGQGTLFALELPLAP